MAEKSDSAAWNTFAWLKACHAMLETGELTRTDFAILFDLSQHCKYGTPDGARPTVPTLSRRAGMHDQEGKQVKDALSRAKKLGLIVAIKRGGGTGESARGTLYRLTMPISGATPPEFNEDDLNSEAGASQINGLNSGGNSGGNSGAVPPPNEYNEKNDIKTKSKAAYALRAKVPVLPAEKKKSPEEKQWEQWHADGLEELRGMLDERGFLETGLTAEKVYQALLAKGKEWPARYLAGCEDWAGEVGDAISEVVVRETVL